jgi:hypothetical protein
MILRYLFDECFSSKLAAELQRREPTLEVEFVGKGGILPKGTLDPVVLIWCEENDYVLVTNNRQTMPQHLIDHLAAGRHIPGAFQVPYEWSVDEMFAELILVAGTAIPGECADHIRYLPISY